ncbi:hypothetical protein BDR26DRAFT_855318 [Obelidium mucronatum]|nr:hypothetical protein BDR26DRAFT_855318 [Obelidium mucronatum]
MKLRHINLLVAIFVDFYATPTIAAPVSSASTARVSTNPAAVSTIAVVALPTQCVSVGTSANGGTCLTRGQSIGQCSYMRAGGLYMTMQMDGNVVAYAGDPTIASITPNTPIWTTGSAQAKSSNPNYHFDYQKDGNFVVYNGATPILAGNTWTSTAKGRTSTHLCLLSTGNLALFSGTTLVGTIVDMNAL